MRSAAALLAFLAGALQQTPPVFRAGVDAVYVDVFVTRGGQPVAGLRAADFELKDNGVQQKLELVQAETLPLRAMLVFDTSSSLDGRRLAALKAAGEAFIAGMRPADEIGLVTFSQEIAHQTAPTTDRGRVRWALSGVQAEGATAVFDALYAGLVLGEGRNRTLVVLFSDGEENMSFLGEEQLRKVVERSNALVHVVAWRDAPRPAGPVTGYQRVIDPTGGEPDHIRSLRTIVEASGGRLWGADSPEKLRAAFAAIADAMGQRYVLRYEPEKVKREGWHELEVKLRGAKGDVQARKGYWVSGR
jgi:VWFA-related protein